MLAREDIGCFDCDARDVQASHRPVSGIAELQGDLSRDQIDVWRAALKLVYHVEPDDMSCHVVCANTQDDLVLLPDALPNSNRHELRQAFCCPLC